jgi:hypothetical protein
MKRAVREIALFAIISQIFVAPVIADDVYNFYFQKAPGPQTVIQGGSGQKSSDLPLQNHINENEKSVISAPAENALASNSVATKVSTPSEATAETKKWEIQAARAMVADPVDSWMGYSLGARYNFNRYLGADLTLVNASDATHGYFNESQNSSWDGTVGVVLTPIYINTFGYDLMQVSVLGGVMSMRDPVDNEINKRGFKPYWGIGVALNFTRNVAMNFEAKMLSDDSRFGHSNVGLVVRF